MTTVQHMKRFLKILKKAVANPGYLQQLQRLYLLDIKAIEKTHESK